MAPDTPVPTLVLYGRADCHLCEVAKEELRELQERVPFRVEERDVDDDPEWAARWGEEVPVAFVGETKVFKFRVDPDRLLRALAAPGGAGADARS